MKMKNSKKNIVTYLTMILMTFFVHIQQVSAASVSNSKIATGTQQLISDLTTWLMILAPVVAGALIIYFFIRRSASDEMDQRKWNNRITTAIISCVGAVLGSVLLNLIIGYYL